MNKRKLLFADNSSLSFAGVRRDLLRLGPVTLVRNLSGELEEAFDRWELLVSTPDRVDGEHRSGWSEVDESDPAWELLDQGADDEADAAAVGDVAPDGRSGSVLVDCRLEAGGVAGGDDCVVVPGRHLARPQFERLVAQAAEIDLFPVGEAMVLADCDAHDLSPD